MIETRQIKNVAEWVLCAPPCNEIGLGMLDAFERALTQIKKAKPSVLIIRSGVSAGFCAGADLKALYTNLLEKGVAQALPEISSFIDRIHGVMNDIDGLEIPTIGVLHGVCFGGGLELALTCDVLIAEPSLRIAFPELRLGLVPGFGGIPRLRRDTGNAVIRDLLLTGRSFNAQKAQQIGWVSQVVAEGKSPEVAMKMAEQISKYHPAVVARAKTFIKPIPRTELEEEKKLFLNMIQEPQVMEALKTFYESRNIRPYLV